MVQVRCHRQLLVVAAAENTVLLLTKPRIAVAAAGSQDYANHRKFEAVDFTGMTSESDQPLGVSPGCSGGQTGAHAQRLSESTAFIQNARQHHELPGGDSGVFNF